ncbi:transport permease protein [Anaeromicropila herbilytica]|uniref:Transport permease protein n=2 Tax=Anaeromicropila herbilytica TaxID=2785025 RepID=A0A7R7ICR9_9FIRM|nr:transport permease protein [Anaeromicropila herbilytica]
MRNLYLITKEDLKNLVKNPMWVFYGAVFPFLFVTILGFLGKDGYGKEVTSFDYYGITLMIYSILSSGMTSANAFMEVTIQKPNMRIVYAPGSEKNIYLSKIIASFLFTFGCHLIDLMLLCGIYHMRIHAIPQILILFALTEIFSVALGVMFCCIFKTEAMANQILGVVINLLAIFGGLLFSLDGYGKVIRTISYISPAKWLVKATFGLIYDHDYSWFYPTAIGMVFAIIVVVAICNKTFRKEDCIC